MHKESIIILDFGSQYSQLIARRIREKQVYCEIHPYSIPIDNLIEMQPKGIVLSGGPASVYTPDAPICDPGILSLNIPILGICYGMQLMAHLLGGKVDPAKQREYGFAELTVDKPAQLFDGLGEIPNPPYSKGGGQKVDKGGLKVWMSHGDRIVSLPNGFEAIAHSGNSPIAAMADVERNLYGLQFHPEVVHTVNGDKILANFAHKICGCSDSWTMSSFISDAIAEVRKKVNGQKILCAASGGVDSTTLAVLLKKAIGENLVCVFVNNGLLRKGEVGIVTKNFQRLGIKLHCVDAGERFLARLAKVTDPEAKRNIIGDEFISVFEAELGRLGKIDFLAQGTLYPDVIESEPVRGPSATIKTHHNVGGLPERLPFQLIEPFRELFKDEVRIVGRQLGIPADILGRHPFPGPSLAIRVLGDVTREHLDVLREADTIYIEEIQKAGLYDEIWQAFAVLLPVRSVGVMGDERTYENVVALRAVTSTDGMTADWAQIPYNVLGTISNRIINEVRGVNRVVYDISSKPPSTIEWE